MDFRSKINKYLNFAKEQPAFLATSISFSYLLVFKAQQGDILEYIMFAIIMGYAYFLQVKNMHKQNLKTQVHESKINFIYDIYKKQKNKSDENNRTHIKISELEVKLKNLE